MAMIVCDLISAAAVGGGMLLLSIWTSEGTAEMAGVGAQVAIPAFFLLTFVQQSCAAQYGSRTSHALCPAD
eukprot:SAG31_NODE_11501_length_1023_cov_1.457792_2_plen_70_part_01